MALLTLLWVPAVAPAAPGASAGCGFTVEVTADPGYGPTPLLVHFNASVSKGTPTFFNWTFGDGSSWNDTRNTSSGPLHRYPTPSLYEVNVTVGDGGCDVEASTNVTAVAGPLQVGISDHPSYGPAPLSVVFNATVSGGTGTYASAIWTFGDGGQGSGLNLVYTFLGPGSYTVVLNVTDSAGHWDEAATEVNVSGDATPTAPSNGLPGWAYLGIGVAVAGAILVVGFRRLSLARLGSGPSGSGPPPGASLSPPTSITTATAEPSARSPTPAAPMSAGSSTGSVEPVSTVQPEKLPRVPSSSRAPRDALQLSERVILHIGRQGVLRADDMAPDALTQSGMAGALALGQNSLTNVLRRLVAAGVVAQELRHVRGRPRRLKVYTLTGRGEQLYRDLRQRAALMARDP